MKEILTQNRIIYVIFLQCALKNHEKLLVELCFGNSFELPPDLTKSAKEFLVPLLHSHSETLKNGPNIQAKLTAWSDIYAKSCHILNNVHDTLTLVKMLKRWKLLLLHKRENLNELEKSLMSSLGGEDPVDFIDSQLLVLLEDSSSFDHKMEVFIGDQIKGSVIQVISNKRNFVYGNGTTSNIWWEILNGLHQHHTIHCSRPDQLQRAFFAWTLEAWLKRMTSVTTSPSENTMLELAILAKPSEELFNENQSSPIIEAFNDIPEPILKAILDDIMAYKELIHSDKVLFWSLVFKIGQAHWTTLAGCDTPQRLHQIFLAHRMKVLSKLNQNIPLNSLEDAIASLFSMKNDDLEDEHEDGEDMVEVENFWDSLSENISDNARMSILDILLQHRDIVAKKKRGLGDPQVVCDRIAVWQKALNVAIEEGVKIENHSKLMRMVREWREQAKKNQVEGIPLSAWQQKLLDIFEEQPIKEEIVDEHEEYTEQTVSEPTKLVIAKAMIRHKSLLFSGKDTVQDSGWRKVYRIAQANGAFYDSINGMRVSIGQWKLKALARLSKDPNAICDLDKLLYQIYDVDIGDLDLDIIKEAHDTPTVKVEPHALTRLTADGQMAILEEVLRLKKVLIATDSSGISTHKDRFYAWHSVLQVANAVGGNFSNILQLSTFIHQSLRSPSVKKLQVQDKINELDLLVAKIYDYDNNCPLEPQYLDHHGFTLDQSDYSGKCRTCGYDVGLSKAALRVHQRSRHSQEVFSCDFCDQAFFTDEDFYSHVRIHVPYNPSETLEEIFDESDVDNKDEVYGYGKQKRRGVYRKRVKIEVQPPDSDEIPRIGKKEGGLCPHCGEVRISYYFQKAKIKKTNLSKSRV